MGSFSYLEPVAASRPSQPRAMGDRTRQFAAHYAAERNCGHPHSNFRWPRRLSARLPATEQLRSLTICCNARAWQGHVFKPSNLCS